MDIVDTIVLGYYREGILLPAATSAIVVIEMTNGFILQAPCQALTTLSANAFGAGELELAGRRLQTGLGCMAVLSVASVLFWCWAGDLLFAVTHADIDVHNVNLFARWRLIGIVPSFTSSILNSWFSGRKIVRPGMYAQMVASICNIFFNLILVHGAFGWEGLGFIGSPIATSLSRWIQFCMLILLAHKELVKCWPSNIGPSFSRRRCSDFLSLCGPHTASAALESFNLQLTAVLAAHFGRQDLAAHNCMLTAFNFLSSGCFSFSGALMSRVSHHLAVGEVPKVKMLVRLVFAIILGSSTVVMIAFFILQDRIGAIFSANEEVRRLCGQLSFLVGGAYFEMSFFFVGMGVLNGMAQPTTLAVAFAVGCYGVGLPTAYVLAFKVDAEVFAWWPYFHAVPGGQLGILGLWIGLCLGYLVVAAIVTIRLCCMKESSWKAAVDKASAMAERDQNPLIQAVELTDQPIGSDGA